MVDPIGLEPMTSSMPLRRSSKLSYGPVPHYCASSAPAAHGPAACRAGGRLPGLPEAFQRRLVVGARVQIEQGRRIGNRHVAHLIPMPPHQRPQPLGDLAH